MTIRSASTTGTAGLALGFRTPGRRARRLRTIHKLVVATALALALAPAARAEGAGAPGDLAGAVTAVAASAAGTTTGVTAQTTSAPVQAVSPVVDTAAPAVAAVPAAARPAVVHPTRPAVTPGQRPTRAAAQTTATRTLKTATTTLSHVTLRVATAPASTAPQVAVVTRKQLHRAVPDTATALLAPARLTLDGAITQASTGLRAAAARTLAAIATVSAVAATLESPGRAPLDGVARLHAGASNLPEALTTAASMPSVVDESEVGHSARAGSVSSGGRAPATDADHATRDHAGLPTIRTSSSPRATGTTATKVPLAPPVPPRGAGSDVAGTAGSSHAGGSPVGADAGSSSAARPDLDTFLAGVLSHAHARTPLLSLERPD